MCFFGVLRNITYPHKICYNILSRTIAFVKMGSLICLSSINAFPIGQVKIHQLIIDFGGHPRNRIIERNITLLFAFFESLSYWY